MSNNFDDIFEPAPQAEDFDKEAWAAKKKAERDEVYALADATAEEVCADGGKFREYLDVQANFRHYSATNALLILGGEAGRPQAGRQGFLARSGRVYQKTGIWPSYQDRRIKRRIHPRRRQYRRVV